jgi:hypothetical protein
MRTQTETYLSRKILIPSIQRTQLVTSSIGIGVNRLRLFLLHSGSWSAVILAQRAAFDHIMETLLTTSSLRILKLSLFLKMGCSVAASIPSTKILDLATTKSTQTTLQGYNLVPRLECRFRVALRINTPRGMIVTSPSHQRRLSMTFSREASQGNNTKTPP